MAYLDHNASSPLPKEVLEELPAIAVKAAGNPSSLHRSGRTARALINSSTETISNFIGTKSAFLYWTSGASEANSWAIHSAVLNAKKEKGILKPVLLISSIEHDSTFLAANFHAQNSDCEVLKIKTLQNGVVDLEHLSELLNTHAKDLALVSVLHANNETGVIQPIAEIGRLCENYKVALHIDCVQSFGKIPLNLDSLKFRYATFSGHKIGAPKGIGFLVVQGEGKILFPLIHGKQQKTLRGGTENPFLIGILGSIIRQTQKGNLSLPKDLEGWHHQFEEKLLSLIPGATIHGKGAPRLPNTSYIGFEGIEGDGLLLNLDLEGIFASSGSACTSGSIDPSHVLLAMGTNEKIARSSVRFSSGRGTTWDDFQKVLDVLPGIIERMRKTR